MNGMRECRESRATPLGRRSVESRGVRGYLPARLGISASRRLVVRDVAQLGSAPEWGSGGRGFKSRRPDWVKIKPHCESAVGLFLAFRPPVRASDSLVGVPERVRPLRRGQLRSGSAIVPPPYTAAARMAQPCLAGIRLPSAGLARDFAPPALPGFRHAKGVAGFQPPRP